MATPRKHPAKKRASRTDALGRRIATMRLPRHGAFYVALASGIVAFLVALWFWPVFAVPLGAITMFAVYLVLVALMFPVLTPAFLRSRADDADTPTVFIFVAVCGVVGVCCVTLFMALNGKDGGPMIEEVVLSIASVLLGWFTINTMAALHYAFEYYGSPSGVVGGGGGPVGGLTFPEGDNPDALAFLYFAYVIGTAFAVSDVGVTSSKMRKVVLIHSTFAYFFNTLIVAATVNVAVAAGGV